MLAPGPRCTPAPPLFCLTLLLFPCSSWLFLWARDVKAALWVHMDENKRKLPISKPHSNITSAFLRPTLQKIPQYWDCLTSCSGFRILGNSVFLSAEYENSLDCSLTYDPFNGTFNSTDSASVLMSCKDYGRKQPWPNFRYSPVRGFCLEGLRKPRNSSVTTAGFRAWTWTR